MNFKDLINPCNSWIMELGRATGFSLSTVKCYSDEVKLSLSNVIVIIVIVVIIVIIVAVKMGGCLQR